MLIILSVFLMLIIFMDGVSAASDENVTLRHDIDEIINHDSNEILTVEESSAGSDDFGLKNENNDILKGSNDNDSLCASINVEGNTFSDIQNAIYKAKSGDILYLDGLYTGSSIINVAKTNITLIGINDVTLDAKGLTSIFSINADHITLKNIKFKNAINAIYCNGNNCIIRDSIFTNNVATDYAGGIFWYGANGVVINSTFINNTGKYGGGIFGYGANDVVINSTFINNTGKLGGAFCWYGDCTVVNSTFINNYADNGGAVYWYGVKGCIFNSSFVNNTGKNGGAIYWASDSGDVANSTFVNNAAKDYGGAIYWASAGVNGVVVNSTFVNNSAKSDGGGVFWYGVDGSIVDSSFVNNSAHLGAGVYWFGSNGTIIDSSFVNNSANMGAGVFLAKNVNVQGSIFSNNFVWRGGAGVLAINNSTIKDSIFENNYASNYGGGISAINSIFDNITVSNNSANVGGGAYVFNSTIKNSKFFKNTANNGTEIYYLNEILLTNNKIEGTIVCLNTTFSSIKDSPPYFIVDGKQYFGFCIEKENGSPESCFLDYSLQQVINKINKQSVSEYLKILIYTYMNSTKINMAYQTYIIDFIDNEYWNSDNSVIKNVISLYDSGLRVPTLNAKKLLSNGTLMIFNFLSTVTPTNGQNTFLFNIKFQNNTNLTVDKKVLNKTIFVGDEFKYEITVYNSGNQTLNDVYVEDNDYTDNVRFIRSVNGTGNWTYSNESIMVTNFYDSTYRKVSSRWILNTPLKPGENRTIILVFKALNNGTVINNVTSGFGQEEFADNSNKTIVYRPNMTVKKITLTPVVMEGSLTTFMILVSNTGDYDLNDVFVVESNYSGLVYDSYDGVDWVKNGDRFSYNGILHVSETVGFNITFKTVKMGNFTNIVIAGSNETDNKTTNNTTEVIKKPTLEDNHTSENKTTIVNKTYLVNKKTSANKTTEKDNITISKIKNSNNKIIFDKKATGNPLLLLLLALFIIPIRRFKK